MRKSYIAFTLIAASVLLTALSLNTYAEDEAVTTVSVKSDVEPRPSGKPISVRSYCPEGKTLIGGGGECYGFLDTENMVVLTLSAPKPVDSAWAVECTNVNANAGDVQAKAWAVCMDTELLEPKKKK